MNIFRRYDKLTFALLFLIAGSRAYTQKADTSYIYLDSNFTRVARSEAIWTAAVYSVSKGYAARFTDNNGRIMLTGVYADRQLRIRNGYFESFYEQGGRKQVGRAVNNLNEGLWVNWYANGKVMDSIYYAGGLKNGKAVTWYEQGGLMSAGAFRNDKPEGTWYWYRENGRPATVEIYKEGRLSDLTCYDSNGVASGYNCSIEKPPGIPGKYGGIEAYITDSLIYPKEALQKKLEGFVDLEFVVTKKGQVENLKVIQSPSAILSEAVTKLIRSVPAWYPAISHNRPVDFPVRLRIPFILPGN